MASDRKWPDIVSTMVRAQRAADAAEKALIPKPCPFCEYAEGKVDLPEGQVTLANAYAQAFSPLDPVAYGHTLVVPTRHVARITELGTDSLSQLMTMVQVAYKQVESKVKPDGVNVIIQDGEAAGGSIEHLHIHIVPRWHDDGKKYSVTTGDWNGPGEL
jgi:diadenosine tetraphosphate (Ap4A) HIT family hydrolase